MRLQSRFRSLVLKAYLHWIRWSGRVIVLGPWRSELGFEALYWLPFLAWAVKYAGIAPDRCIAVSRGGMGVFAPAMEQIDLYSLRSVDDVRRQNGVDALTNGVQKHIHRTAWDDAVCADAVLQLAPGRKWACLHPSWMYWLFADVWDERETLRHVLAHTRFDALPVPSLPDGLTLPDKFIAVRFYERHTLPLTDGVRAQIKATVEALASHMPVVLLNQDLFADDHVDMPLTGENIITLPPIPAHQNFILQAAVLGRCSAFVGTYGGVAQWALRYGKPAIGFYLKFAGTAQCHRTLSAMLSAAADVPFEVSAMPCIKLWGMALMRVLPDGE